MAEAVSEDPESLAAVLGATYAGGLALRRYRDRHRLEVLPYHQIARSADRSLAEQRIVRHRIRNHGANFLGPPF